MPGVGWQPASDRANDFGRRQRDRVPRGVAWRVAAGRRKRFPRRLIRGDPSAAPDFVLNGCRSVRTQSLQVQVLAPSSGHAVRLVPAQRSNRDWSKVPVASTRVLTSQKSSTCSIRWDQRPPCIPRSIGWQQQILCYQTGVDTLRMMETMPQALHRALPA